MPEPRLKSGLWVRAMLRVNTTKGVFCTVARHGDEDAGAILLKQNLMGAGFRVLTRMRDAEGALAWMAGTGPAPVDEKTADAYIARQVDRDSDLWVVEIEDKEATLPFGEKLVE